MAAVVTLGAVGCGNTDDGDNGDDDQKKLEPLELSSDKLGVGFHHGEAATLKGNDLVGEAGSTFSTAFVDVQLYANAQFYTLPPNRAM